MAHWSSCAVHNEPAFPNGECDCGNDAPERDHGLVAGDVIHLDPRKLPDLVVITKEYADMIADSSPKREFVVTVGESTYQKNNFGRLD